MAVRLRNGFTLVEMLVVISIIAILIAMMMPAVMLALEAARLANCSNNQAQLGLAIIRFEHDKQRYPGYRDKVVFPGDSDYVDPRWGDVTDDGDSNSEQSWYKGGRWESWVVVVLPFLGKKDLYERWQDATLDVEKVNDDGLEPNGKLINVAIQNLICPSRNYETIGSSLSYVANTGKYDRESGSREKDDRYNGVFHDQMWRKPIRLSQGDVSRGDGTRTTLLLTENVQAYKYGETAVDNNGWQFKQEWVGVVWWPDASPVRRINGDKLRIPRQDKNYARPSSDHASGAVVTYCDGTVGVLDDGIDYEVYQRLLTIDDNEVSELQESLDPLP